MKLGHDNIDMVPLRVFEAKYTAGAFEHGVSFVIGFVPLVGDAKDLQEALTGIDYITMEELSIGERILSGAFVLIPIANGKAGRETIEKVGKILEDIGCFTAGTKIVTEAGLKNIEDIKSGEYVLAKNMDTGKSNYREVLRTFVKQHHSIVVIKINGKIIEATSDHPFWVKGKGWVVAGELSEEDILEDEVGREVEIDEIQINRYEEPITVYNFEVADDHNYYVSDMGILVHNNNPCAEAVEKLAKGASNSGDDLIRQLKDAKFLNRKNKDIIEANMKQLADNDYKVILRRDYDNFAHGDLNHWNLEVQTSGGNIKFNRHIYLDDSGTITQIVDLTYSKGKSVRNVVYDILND